MKFINWRFEDIIWATSDIWYKLQIYVFATANAFNFKVTLYKTKFQINIFQHIL